MHSGGVASGGAANNGATPSNFGLLPIEKIIDNFSWILPKFWQNYIKYIHSKYNIRQWTAPLEFADNIWTI